MKTYSLHPDVYADLFEILSFIADTNPIAAERVQAKIRKEFETAAERPLIGHLREDLTSRPLRFRSVYKYLIAYAPISEPVTILAVLYGNRDPELLSSILKDREEKW